MYLLYLIALFIYILDKGNVSFLFLGLFAIYFTLFEVLQIFINKFEYFTDFWNLFDFSRTLLLIAFIFLILTTPKFEITDKNEIEN